MSTLDDVRHDFSPIQVVEQVIVDYEITEFERCYEISIVSPVSYNNTGFSSKLTIGSPLTPIKQQCHTTRTRVISRNATTSSTNIVAKIRSSSVMTYTPERKVNIISKF